MRSEVVEIGSIYLPYSLYIYIYMYTYMRAGQERPCPKSADPHPSPLSCPSRSPPPAGYGGPTVGQVRQRRSIPRTPRTPGGGRQLGTHLAPAPPSARGSPGPAGEHGVHVELRGESPGEVRHLPSLPPGSGTGGGGPLGLPLGLREAFFLSAAMRSATLTMAVPICVFVVDKQIIITTTGPASEFPSRAAILTQAAMHVLAS